jgi:hypothetical protein
MAKKTGRKTTKKASKTAKKAAKKSPRKKVTKKKVTKKTATRGSVMSKDKKSKTTIKSKTPKTKSADKPKTKAAFKPKGKKAAALKPVITLTSDQIAARAYVIWESNGRQHGHDDHNWREAERQLLAEAGV